MRDDLHKGAPLPRRWSTVIRRAVRDADWQVGTRHAIESALMTDVRAVLSNPRVGRVIRESLSAQGSVFSPSELLPFAPHDELYTKVREHVVIHHEEGFRGRELLLQALGSAVNEELKAKSREILAHTKTRQESAVPEMRRRLAVATDGVCEAVARMALDGEKPPRKLTLNLDADLLGGLE